jgi:hypothetical protein
MAQDAVAAIARGRTADRTTLFINDNPATAMLEGTRPTMDKNG